MLGHRINLFSALTELPNFSRVSVSFSIPSSKWPSFSTVSPAFSIWPHSVRNPGAISCFWDWKESDSLLFSRYLLIIDCTGPVPGSLPRRRTYRSPKMPSFVHSLSVESGVLTKDNICNPVWVETPEWEREKGVVNYFPKLRRPGVASLPGNPLVLDLPAWGVNWQAWLLQTCWVLQELLCHLTVRHPGRMIEATVWCAHVTFPQICYLSLKTSYWLEPLSLQCISLS